MNRLLITLFVCAFINNASAQQILTAKDYAQAEKFLGYNTQNFVDNAPAQPNWMAGDRFWYRNLGANGTEFIIVDPAKGNVTGQTLLLAAIFVGMAVITDSSYALITSSLAERLRGSRHFQKGQRYFAGLVYVGLGITTAFTGSKK